MFWTGGIIHSIVPFLEEFWGPTIRYFEKTVGKREAKLSKGDKEFVAGAIRAGWKFRCGERSVPKRIVDSRRFFITHFQCVCDSVGHFYVPQGNLKKKIKFTLEVQHESDFIYLLGGLKEYGAPMPRVERPKNPSTSGHHLAWTCRADIIALMDFIGWESLRPRNQCVMKYLAEDRDPMKRRFS